jgi:hypothetical protein
LECINSQKSQINGVVDLILENADESTRYVVEIMLGKIDPSHIIRLIEYWDVEKRRNPSWSYEAVLIAEDTTRYLNVGYPCKNRGEVPPKLLINTCLLRKNANFYFPKLPNIYT